MNRWWRSSILAAAAVVVFGVKDDSVASEPGQTRPFSFYDLSTLCASIPFAAQRTGVEPIRA
jgi:hypothetical protein